MSGPGYRISDLYHKFKGSEWDPWETYLMRSNSCKFVIVRDNLTSRNLKNKKIDAQFLGNPMMDFVQDKKIDLGFFNGYKRLILLIGSRFPEAYNNFKIFLSSLNEFHYPQKCIILMPLSSNANINKIEKQLINYKFVSDQQSVFLIGEESIWVKNNMTLLIARNTFNQWAYLAEIGLGNAGTATEQICGLGIPVLSLPGKGPQFTKSFAMRQQRLLGGSAFVCRNKNIFKEKLFLLLSNKKLRSQKGKIGRRRMGPSGASQKIVDYINLKLF